MQMKPKVEETEVQVVVIVSDTIPILCCLCQESPTVKPLLSESLFKRTCKHDALTGRRFRP
jgi:hypothetical protein